MDDSCKCWQMLTISVDNYTIAVKIVDDFDKLTSIYGFYRPTGYAGMLCMEALGGMQEMRWGDEGKRAIRFT
jgi:hypothetical protein